MRAGGPGLYHASVLESAAHDLPACRRVGVVTIASYIHTISSFKELTNMHALRG
jgi:hypothetical protein